MERVGELIAKKGSLFNRLRQAWYTLHPRLTNLEQSLAHVDMQRYREARCHFKYNLYKIEGRLDELGLRRSKDILMLED